MSHDDGLDRHPGTCETRGPRAGRMSAAARSLLTLGLAMLVVLPAAARAGGRQRAVSAVPDAHVDPVPPELYMSAEPPEPPVMDDLLRRELAVSVRPTPPVPSEPGAESAHLAPMSPSSGSAEVIEPQAAGSFAVFRNVDLGPGAPNTTTSVVNEPSVGTDGPVVFETGNWFGALSTDGGQSFAFVNPFTGPFAPVNGGFCCDQVTLYDPVRNARYWLQDYIPDATTGTHRINVDANGDGTWDCAYDFNPQQVGFSAGHYYDFPDLVLGQSFLYHTANVFNRDGTCSGGTCTTGRVGTSCSFDLQCDTFAGTVLSRYPINGLATCSLGPYQSAVVTDGHGSFRATHNAGPTVFWASHNSTSSIRIYRWDESNPTTYFFDDVAINAWNNDAQTCPGSDGTDWCRRSDSRILGAYLANGVLGFMWNASQGGPFPFPHVQVAQFRASDRALLSQVQIWNSSYPFLYPSVGVNARGHLGGTMFASNPPVCIAYIADDVNGGVLAPLEDVPIASSTDGPASDSWGDFLSARPHFPFANTWVGSCYSLQGGGQNANARPAYVWFGRERDSPTTSSTTTTNTTTTNTTIHTTTTRTTTTNTTTTNTVTTNTTTSNTTTTTVGTLCGNGRLDPGEQCDDGNQLNNDCCTTACVAQRRGTPCGSGASSECDAPDSCDSSGHCLENHVPTNTPCGDDGNVCTADVCDGAGSCGHPPGNAGAQCRAIGSLGPCDAGDTCDGQNVDCPLTGIKGGCFARVPDTVQGKRAIGVTCEAQAGTVQGGTSRCIATGFQAAPTPGAAKANLRAQPASEGSECSGKQVTSTVKTTLKSSGSDPFRQRRLKLKLNAYGRRLLRQQGALKVCVEVTIKHGTASSTTDQIVEIVR